MIEQKIINVNMESLENAAKALLPMESGKGVAIANPYLSENMMEEVDPYTYYGDTFIKWQKDISKVCFVGKVRDVGFAIEKFNEDDYGYLYNGSNCRDAVEELFDKLAQIDENLAVVFGLQTMIEYANNNNLSKVVGVWHKTAVANAIASSDHLSIYPFGMSFDEFAVEDSALPQWLSKKHVFIYMLEKIQADALADAACYAELNIGYVRDDIAVPLGLTKLRNVPYKMVQESSGVKELSEVAKGLSAVIFASEESYCDFLETFKHY
jgi:hypothetical protein